MSKEVHPVCCVVFVTNSVLQENREVQKRLEQSPDNQVVILRQVSPSEERALLSYALSLLYPYGG